MRLSRSARARRASKGFNSTLGYPGEGPSPREAVPDDLTALSRVDQLGLPFPPEDPLLFRAPVGVRLSVSCPSLHVRELLKKFIDPAIKDGADFGRGI